MEHDFLSRESSQSEAFGAVNDMQGATMAPPPFQLHASSGGKEVVQRQVEYAKKESERNIVVHTTNLFADKESLNGKKFLSFDDGDTVQDAISFLGAEFFLKEGPKGHFSRIDTSTKLTNKDSFKAFRRPQVDQQLTAKAPVVDKDNPAQILSYMMWQSLRKSGIDCHEIQGMLTGSTLVFSSNNQSDFSNLNSVFFGSKLSKKTGNEFLGTMIDEYEKAVVNKLHASQNKRDDLAEAIFPKNGQKNWADVKAHLQTFLSPIATAPVMMKSDFSQVDFSKPGITLLDGVGDSLGDKTSEQENGPMHAEQVLMLSLINYLLSGGAEAQNAFTGAYFGGVKTACNNCAPVMATLAKALQGMMKEEVRLAKTGINDTHYTPDKMTDLVNRKGELLPALEKLAKETLGEKKAKVFAEKVGATFNAMK